jgi:hypothetical protein
MMPNAIRADSLISGLEPEWEHLSHDANIRGSVAQRLDPLLNGLPSNVVLTAACFSRLGIDRHELAYLVFENWRRAAPEAFRAGASKARGDLVGTLLRAQEYAIQHGLPFEPHWLFQPGDFAPVEPKLERGMRDQPATFPQLKDLIARSGEVSGLLGPDGLGIVVHTGRAGSHGLTFRRDDLGWRVELGMQPCPSGQWRLERIPTLVLEPLLRILRGFPKSARAGVFLPRERAEVAERAQAVGNALEKIVDKRYKVVGERVRRTLEAFESGGLESAVGELPPNGISIAAKLVPEMLPAARAGRVAVGRQRDLHAVVPGTDEARQTGSPGLPPEPSTTPGSPRKRRISASMRPAIASSRR